MCNLKQNAKRVSDYLRENDDKIVFAESCTAGLLSSTLARFPGASEILCGSAVVYRPSQKRSILGINEATMDVHTTESRTIVHEMLSGISRKSPEATVAVSVVGHLGPNAPQDRKFRDDSLIDGEVLVYVKAKTKARGKTIVLESTEREERMEEAATKIFEFISETLKEWNND